jgi:3-oxoisoapionate decarboxylase
VQELRRTNSGLNRRTAIARMTGTAACLGLGIGCGNAGQSTGGKLGIVSYTLGYRFGGFSTIASNRNEQRPRKLIELMDYLQSHDVLCLQIENGHIPLNDQPALEDIRRQAESCGMTLEVAGPTVGASSMAKMMHAAQVMGVKTVRVMLGMLIRAKKQVTNLEEWNAFRQKSIDGVREAVELGEQMGLNVVVENHTDVTADELLEILDVVGLDRTGVLLDFGNQLPVAEDVIEAVTKLAPYAKTTHVKDWVLHPTDDGCTITMVPLGQGVLPLPELLRIVRSANPDINVVIENIVEQNLPVPYKDDAWWGGFPGRANRRESTSYMEAMLEQSPPYTLHNHLAMTEQEALEVEEKNFLACIQYARETLGVTG